MKVLKESCLFCLSRWVFLMCLIAPLVPSEPQCCRIASLRVVVVRVTVSGKCFQRQQSFYAKCAIVVLVGFSWTLRSVSFIMQDAFTNENHAHTNLSASGESAKPVKPPVDL